MIVLTAGIALLQASTSQAGQGSLVDPNAINFQGAISGLANTPTLYLQLQGSTVYKGKTTPLVSNLSWSSTTTGTYQTNQVELETYVNGILTKRIVGDGSTLWSYDLNQHRYSATSYGGSGAVRPDTYTTDLLNDLNWAASGQDGYLAKLLRQIYNSVNPTYTSWMPGVMSIALQQDWPVTDPVNPNLTYTSTPSDNFYMYDGSPKKTIIFEITSGGATSSAGAVPITGLANIYFNQLETIARYKKLTQWQITPYTGVTFAADLFQPYAGKSIQGWQPVVGPRPVNN